MQPLPGGLDPGLEPVAFLALRPDQYNPRRLDEGNAQITIAALGYLAEDRTVPGGDLFGHESQPCGEVAAFGESIAHSDRGHGCSRDDRPDSRHAHQTLAGCILACESLDFLR